MKMIRLMIGLVGLVMFGFGCASSTPQKSGFLSGDEKLKAGKFLQEWWTAGAIDKHTLSKIYIEPIDVTRIKDASEISVMFASNFLAQTVAFQIRAHSSFEVVSERSSATATIALAITYMMPGSAGGREFGGEFGMGDAIVQMDGKVTDVGSGKEIAAFEHRRVDSASGGTEDLGGNSSQRLVRRSMDSICNRLTKELVAATGQ